LLVILDNESLYCAPRLNEINLFKLEQDANYIT